MSVKISTTNSKLGIIPSINLPPIVTCRENCPCAKDCYATKGNFRFQNVKASHIHNYNTYLENPVGYFNAIKKEINNGFVSYAYFRWHAAGDIIDDLYFAGMINLANDLPGTQFLAFTKKFEIVNRFLDTGNILPENLHIVYSSWGKEFNVENPYSLPVAYVKFKDENKNGDIPESAVECSGNCTSCLQCWQIKNGESVVFNKH